MSDLTPEETAQDELDAQTPTEIELLRERAKTLNLSHHPSMGLAKLKALVKEAMEPKPDVPDEAPVEAPTVAIAETPATIPTPPETAGQARARLHKESNRLVRVVVSCLNPRKQEQEFQMFSVSNSVIGTVTKVVPFDVEEGFHVPQIILDQMLEAECQVFHTVAGPRGNKVRRGKLVKEFSVRILTPLTQEQLTELASDQKKRNNLD